MSDQPPYYLENSLEFEINQKICNVLEKTFQLKLSNINLEFPHDSDHGDLSCNVAMQIARKLKRPPLEIAQKIIENLPPIKNINAVKIAGSGFINFYYTNPFLFQELTSIEDNKKFNFGHNLPVCIEYSSPNIAKPFAIHHILSTIIGQAICNLYHELNYRPIAVNHLGDWGTQFGKLIYAYRAWGEEEAIIKNPINELLNLYVKFHDFAEQDPALLEKAREEMLKLEQGNEENRALWEWFVKISLDDFNKMYQRLGGIHFDHILGESFYIDKSKEIITEGQKTGVITTGEGGALLFFFPNDQYPPLMVQRSDGATLYASRDLAQVKYRSQTWNIIKNIITTDSAQELHFKQYFTAAKIMGLNKTKEGETELVHVCFGRMSFRDQKMSTRKGNILLLADVLDEAEERALTLIQSKESNLNPAEQRELARIMGIGSIKYNILSQNRLTNIVFDWDKMLSFEGNAAPYIQYTYARARSILRKTKSIETLRLPAEYNLNQAEREILCLFSRFPSILLQSAREYYPHLLSNFLYELTQKFNTFYNSTPVLNAPTDDQRHFRLLLVDKTSIVIKKIMRILGIEVPEKM